MTTDNHNKSSELRPGTMILHKSGTAVVLSHRKADGTGWWNTDRSGLADFVLDGEDHGDWTIVTPELILALQAAAVDREQ